MMRRFGMVAGLLAAGLVMVAAAPAGAGTGIDLKASKHASGPFEGSVRRHVQLGEKRNVFLRAKNLEGSPLNGALMSSEAEGNYTFKYFKSNGTNITDKVIDEGYFFTLSGGSAKTFRMQIKAKTGTTQECVGPHVAYSGGDAGVPVMINFPSDLFCILL